MILLHGTRKQVCPVQIALLFSTLQVTIFITFFLSITGLKKIIKNILVIREMLYLKLFFFPITVEEEEANKG